MTLINTDINRYFHMIPLWKSPIKLPVDFHMIPLWESPIKLPVELPVELVILLSVWLPLLRVQSPRVHRVPYETLGNLVFLYDFKEKSSLGNCCCRVGMQNNWFSHLRASTQRSVQAAACSDQKLRSIWVAF